MLEIYISYNLTYNPTNTKDLKGIKGLRGIIAKTFFSPIADDDIPHSYPIFHEIITLFSDQ
jgi:hypothetical protein